LEEISEKLHCKVDITKALRVAAQARIELKADAIPAFPVTLIEGMNNCETIERVILLVHLFIAFACHYHVQGKFPKVFHLQLL
jgi:hypothetical protein